MDEYNRLNSARRRQAQHAPRSKGSKARKTDLAATATGMLKIPLGQKLTIVGLAFVCVYLVVTRLSPSSSGRPVSLEAQPWQSAMQAGAANQASQNQLGSMGRGASLDMLQEAEDELYDEDSGEVSQAMAAYMHATCSPSQRVCTDAACRVVR